LKAARERLGELRGSRHAARTVEAYASDWKHFEAWCVAAKRAALPADPETVALYLSDLAPKFKASTLERRVAAIAAKHLAADLPAPITPTVRSVIVGVRRRARGGVRRMAAITPDELARVLDDIGSADDSRRRVVRAARDRAALALGFAGAFRRSELVGLQLADVEVGKDRVQVTLGRSKTDQQARGRVLVIPRAKRAGLCAVRLVAAWLRVRGDWAGPLFCNITAADELDRRPLDAHSIYYALREGAKRAGLDSRRFGAHSLRAGAVTAAADAGVDAFSIMELTGHRSVETVARYVRRSVSRYALAKVL